MNNKVANLAVIHNELHSASKVVNLSLYQRGEAIEPMQDLRELIVNSCYQIENIVPHSAYSYCNAELGIEIKNGAADRHSCTYALTFEGQDLGELKLTRHYPFEDIELDLVEMLFCCLVFPLKNAIASYKALAGAYNSPLTHANKLVSINGR